MQSACAVGLLPLGGYRLVAAVHTGRREGCCSIRALNLEPWTLNFPAGFWSYTVSVLGLGVSGLVG